MLRHYGSGTLSSTRTVNQRKIRPGTTARQTPTVNLSLKVTSTRHVPLVGHRLYEKLYLVNYMLLLSLIHI